MRDPAQADSKIRLYSTAKASLRSAVVVGWTRALLGAGAALLVGGIVGRLIDDEPVGMALVGLTGIITVRAALTTFVPVLSNRTATAVERELRSKMLGAALRINPTAATRTGETVTRATEGVEAVGALAGTFLPQLVAGMSTPILLGLVVALIDWPTALVLLLILPIAPVLLRMLEKRFASVSARYRSTADQLAARFLDGVQGMRTLKALNQADNYGDEIASEAELLRTETMSLLRVNQLALLGVDSLFTLGTVVAAGLMAATRLSSGAITPGDGVSLVILGVMLIDPLSQIGRYFYVGAIGRASAIQIRDVLSDLPASPTGPEKAEAGGIKLNGVALVYPDGTKALASIDLELRPGESAALVGPSGAGKTTIAHLVLGLLEPTEGSVSVGGSAVLVPQRPFLFYGSVADNLRIARPEATDDELWEALRGAQLESVIAARPDGLATVVGERGLRLSGGEVQRLAIARALLVDAPIVVLDEPTSNVDLESEARLREALASLVAGRTLLIIAHRRSTIAGVDKVFVVESGFVVDTGSGSDARRIISDLGARR